MDLSAHSLNPSTPFKTVSERILTTLDLAVFFTRGSSGIDYCSDSLYAVLGYPSQMLRVKGWPFFFSLIHPRDRRLLAYKQLASLSKGAFYENEICRLTIRLRHSNGKFMLVAFDIQSRSDVEANLVMVYVRNISGYGDWERSVLKTSRRESSRPMLEQEAFRHDVFTPSERKIARLIAQGFTSRQIGYAMNLSAHTIRTHRTNLLRKSGCSNAAQLSIYLATNR